MKSLVRALAVFALWAPVFFTMSSCDKIAQLATINVPMTIPVSINVNASTLPSTAVNDIDVSTNKSFIDNKDRIKGADITQVSLLLNNYTGTPDMNAAVYSKIEYTLKFDPSYGDNTEYSLGSFENVKPADFMGTKKSFNVNNGPLNDAMDKLRDRPKFKVFSKYTLQSGAGTIEAMNGTLEFTFSLVAGV